MDRGEEFRKLLSKIRKERPSSGQFKKGHKTNIGRKHTPQSITNMVKSAQEKKFIKHIIEHSNIRPTTPEKYFIGICSKYQLPFKYVGDGSFWIKNMNPDFISIEENRIAIDIFGDYWHGPLLNPKINSSRRYNERIKLFRTYGWKLIVIWESELANERIVLKKLGIEDEVKQELEALEKLVEK